MKPSYTKWRQRLAGEKVETFTEPDENDVGFYRLPIREKQPNGRWKVLGWKPVALYVNGEELIAWIGNKALIGTEIGEQWPWFVKHPITEDLYRGVTERGEPWPDAKPPMAVGGDFDQVDMKPGHITYVNRTIRTEEDRQAVKEDMIRKGTWNEALDEPEQPLDVQHAAAIDAAIGAAPKAIGSEQDAAVALGSKNRIAELRLAADKAGKAIYEPIYRQYTAEQKKWSPIVARATAEEKRLNTEILSFRERERQRIAAEKAEAERKQREHDEANERAAQRAIARGEPEPEPVVEPELLVASKPAPIVPTYGTRGVKEELKRFVVIDDLAAVFVQFKADPQLVERLTKLAQAEIDAGRNVPGTHVREGLI